MRTCNVFQHQPTEQIFRNDFYVRLLLLDKFKKQRKLEMTSINQPTIDLTMNGTASKEIAKMQNFLSTVYTLISKTVFI